MSLLPYDVWVLISLFDHTVWYALSFIVIFDPVDIERAKKLFVKRVTRNNIVYNVLPNGWKHGPCFRFDKDEYDFSTWIDGRMEGWHHIWLGTRLVSEGYYLHDKLTGISRIWYVSGRLAEVTDHNRDVTTSWYPSGQIRSILRRWGVNILWYADGTMAHLYHTNNYQRCGICLFWYRNGTKRLECHYNANELLHGPYREWHPDGTLSRLTCYSNGIFCDYGKCHNITSPGAVRH